MHEIFINFISCCIINILFIKQMYMKYEMKTSKTKLSLILLLFTIVTAAINSYRLPLLNLIVTLSSFLLLKTILFNVKFSEELREDFLVFFILVFIDSLSFFLAGIIYPIDMMYFRPLTSSVMTLFLGTMLLNIFKFSRIERVPKYEILLCLFITTLSIVLIYIFSINYSFTNKNFKIIIIIIIIGLIIMNMIVFHYLEYIDKNYELSERLIKEQLEANLMNQHYQDLKNQYLETRMLVHDFKNHIYTMSIAYQNKKIELAENILKQFIEQCNNIKIKYLTGIDILDIILNEKAIKANQLGIKFDFIMEDVKLDWIKEFDMITIFGNLLDNAIEANDELFTDKYIKISIYQKHDMIVIQQSNSCINDLVTFKNTIKSTKEGHSGIGLQNVRKAVEAYEGILDISLEKNKFDIVICFIAKY